METAFKLSLAAIVVGVVIWVLDTFVISPSGLEEMREATEQQDATVQLDRSGVFVLVTSALWWLVAFKMREGRN